ncbi:PE family protein [Mycobacterium lepromatosis]|uniref:PE family protein n=2 Tax=Mycobacterium lepromatosis TaxID=480418 RepID=A0A0F4ESD2_9MYCO|nr:PE family protein [Mycobacterium lepromatosis]KJX75734.1 PE family protein [Mycobacterium lepromatosis]UKN41766.1 PbsX family transcriptional regulator [Mycobacterium lepromatosis]
MPLFLKVEVGGLIMAAGRLDRISSQVKEQNIKLATAITNVPAPALDPVSQLASRFFTTRGVEYQAHAEAGAESSRAFVQSLTKAAGDYMTSDVLS